MQQDKQLWLTLLWLSGGKEGTPFMVPSNPGPQLQIRSADTNKDVPIQRKSIHDPHQVLGHHKAPAGIIKIQEKFLLNKANKYTEKIAKSTSQQHE
eukprot:13084171-Ditylum_brightwellii.AAC.1